MADFVAVLRKTIGSLGENSPEMREKVYEKARATIGAKLAAINPPPPQMVIDRQTKALEDAIAVVRAEYDASGEQDDDNDLEDVFASLEGRPVPVRPQPQPAPALDNTGPDAESAVPDDPEPERVPQAEVEPELSSAPEPIVHEAGSEPISSVAQEREFDRDSEFRQPEARDTTTPDPALAPPPRPRPARKQVGGRTGLIAAVVALLVVAAAGYGIWINRDDFVGMLGLGGGTQIAAEPEAADVALDEATDEAAPEEVAAVEPAVAPAAPTAAEAEKLTQRLLPDGSEVDEGPAGGTGTIGEGTSLAAVVPPEGGEGAPALSDGGAAPTGDVQGSQPAVAVGQRAIFYEERTSTSEGSAEVGAIVWSAVRESPGGDLPPEPAIRAEATIPGKDLQLRMTIRRNGDDTLPASHMIEMIFLTPEGFEGGAISNISRVTFKDSEEAAGNPLFGIPAKIADGFFLLALSDNAAETEANLTLMRRQSWIDIPIVYQSGRRALITLEKGVPGDRIFEEALRSWANASSG